MSVDSMSTTFSRRAAALSTAVQSVFEEETMPPAITIDNLEFSYGDSPVLDSIDLKIAAGEVVCLLGPNGVGKTTLVENLLGSLSPRQDGSASWAPTRGGPRPGCGPVWAWSSRIGPTMPNGEWPTSWSGSGPCNAPSFALPIYFLHYAESAVKSSTFTL